MTRVALSIVVLSMVNLHGHNALRAVIPRVTGRRNRVHDVPQRPADPQSLKDVNVCVEQMYEWMREKERILVLTGAGVSTESGIPDYRGHNGSYHFGHKPMIHDQFMSSVAHRQRYWGRALVGWRDFDRVKSNEGHFALAEMERLRLIGVQFEDKPEYHASENEERWAFGNGQNRISIVTQNVDHLHQKAGAAHVTELHGRTNRLKCMSCGYYRSRHQFHGELESSNQEWLSNVLQQGGTELRPDGDANIVKEDYRDVSIPPCPRCGGFFKPDVVFFGDSVPKHRVERCRAALDASDGLFCIGTSLAVHSAYRFVRIASQRGIPIGILNVGETRAENEGLDITKIEGPIGATLSGVLHRFSKDERLHS